MLIGSIVTFLLALWVWKMPFDDGVRAYLYGSATGVWNVDWITFWGVMLFNTLVATGAFDKLRRWLIQQGTPRRAGADHPVRLGFWRTARGPGRLRLSMGLRCADPDLARHPDLDAIRVAAIANNAPVSYGALGAPIIALAAVTGYAAAGARPARSARSSPSWRCCRPGFCSIWSPAGRA